MEGVPKDCAHDRADIIFRTVDTNGEEEFCQGCLKDPDFYRIVQGMVDKLRLNRNM